MRTWGQIRIGSVALTVAFLYLCFFSNIFSDSYGTYIFFCAINVILYSHYVMSFVASRHSFLKMLRFTRGRLILGGLFSLAMVSNWIEPELGYFYFGAHFALSETYSRFLLDRDGAFYSSIKSDLRLFRTLHLLFMLSLFFYATSHTLEYVRAFYSLTQIIPQFFYTYLFVWTGFTYFCFLFTNAKSLFPSRDWNSLVQSYIMPELGLLGLAIFSHAMLIHWSVFVLYHIAYWLVAPIFTRSRLTEARAWVTYALPTAGLMLIAFFAFPSFGPSPAPMPHAYLPVSGHIPFYGFDLRAINAHVVHAFRLSLIWGNFHILFSLAASALNPRAVRKTVSPSGHDPFMATPAVS